MYFITKAQFLPFRLIPSARCQAAERARQIPVVHGGSIASRTALFHSYNNSIAQTYSENEANTNNIFANEG